MTPYEAKELCLLAHEGQYRRPIELTYDEVAKLLNVDVVPNKTEKILPDGSKLTWDDLCESYFYQLPYATHPIAVANMLITDDERIVAYLHDVVEDTSAEFDGLASIKFEEKFYELTIDQVIALRYITHLPNVSYNKYITGLTVNKLATKVKLADIAHNLSTNPCHHKEKKYAESMKILLNSI